MASGWAGPLDVGPAYGRRGWNDAGLFDYAAAGEHGPIPVPCHRYEKVLPEAADGDR